MTTDAFINIVRKYTRAKKLTTRMLNELIQRIEVHQAEKRMAFRCSDSQFITTALGHWIFPMSLHWKHQK